MKEKSILRKTKSRIALIIVLTLVMQLIVPMLTNQNKVYATEESFSLGHFNFSTKKFSNATGSGNVKYKSLLIAYGNVLQSGENLTLPNVNGFTKSDNASTNYSTVINMTDGKTPTEIANYVKEITFNNSPEGQTISIVISDKVLDNKTFYYEGTQHYYQFIAYDGTEDMSWLTAYNSAKNLTYGGRQGYLATITNLNEDSFIYNAASEVGWLGGTALKYQSESGNLYYTYDVSGINSSKASINNDDRIDSSWSANEWYWACGPERGTTFYPSIYDTAYDTYSNQGYYFNWNNGEPNNGAQYSNYSKENCLATLRSGRGYKSGSQISNYSWNDIPYSNLPLSFCGRCILCKRLFC